jgi:4-amino-4-deoxy-L-arabinose transferase-like glycosyltransferase
MLTLAVTLQRWPQAGLLRGSRASQLVALTAALAFVLSPLNLIWGRLAVSDALLSSLVAISLLLFWQTQASRPRDPGTWPGWWRGWVVLGLAVLAKGPVAVVLVGLSLLAFALSQGELRLQLRGLRAGAGLGLTAAVALPWYIAELLVEGRPYWDSFFGYHNLQRFTGVVNDHLQPWWFFGGMLVIASLPVTPLLLLGLGRHLLGGARPPDQSLGRLAACWLLVVLVFFTTAATKLPSYWIPATPAAGVLIALAACSPPQGGRQRQLLRLAWGLSLALAAAIALVLALAPRWFGVVSDPEMPTLAAAVLASGHLLWAALCWGLAALLPLLLLRAGGPGRLLALQLPLVAFAVLALQPLWALGDRLRGEPVRQMAAAAAAQRRPQESLAMVGILKPSLHYYSRRVVLYEGNEPTDLANLADRLQRERRRGQEPSTARQQPTVLVVIDARTAALPHWQGLAPIPLAQAGLYRLWRLDRSALERRAAQLAQGGIRPRWQEPRPERY